MCGTRKKPRPLLSSVSGLICAAANGNNKNALVQVMSLRRTGDKPLHETMLTQFADGSMTLGSITRGNELNNFLCHIGMGPEWINPMRVISLIFCMH